MRLAILGTGYVGLVTGTCFADFGNMVACIDKDAAKVEGLRQGRIPIYEPGLQELVERNSREGRLSFTTNLAAGIAAALVFGLYVLTLSPDTAMWDTSEYITAAYTLGIPHPPGNPFFVLMGRVFALLPIAPNVAMRINVMAALSSAVSAGKS